MTSSGMTNSFPHKCKLAANHDDAARIPAQLDQPKLQRVAHLQLWREQHCWIAHNFSYFERPRPPCQKWGQPLAAAMCWARARACVRESSRAASRVADVAVSLGGRRDCGGSLKAARAQSAAAIRRPVKSKQPPPGESDRRPAGRNNFKKLRATSKPRRQRPHRRRRRRRHSLVTTYVTGACLLACNFGCVVIDRNQWRACAIVIRLRAQARCALLRVVGVVVVVVARWPHSPSRSILISSSLLVRTSNWTIACCCCSLSSNSRHYGAQQLSVRATLGEGACTRG